MCGARGPLWAVIKEVEFYSLLVWFAIIDEQFNAVMSTYEWPIDQVLTLKLFVCMIEFSMRTTKEITLALSTSIYTEY